MALTNSLYLPIIDYWLTPKSNMVSLYSIYVQTRMVEALLSGIVLGLIPITLAGLFVTAYLQYRRGDQLEIR